MHVRYNREQEGENPDFVRLSGKGKYRNEIDPHTGHQPVPYNSGKFSKKIQVALK